MPSVAVPRVLLVDDHALLLDGLHGLFAGEWNIVGRLHSLGPLVQTVHTTRPHVVVLDVGMRDGNSFHAARDLKRQVPDVQIIFLTMYEDAHLVTEAFRVGASAYVVKRSAPSDLATAVRAVVDGEHYISPVLTHVVVESLGTPTRPVDLSPRQEDVLRLLAKGYVMKEIATALDISTRTVAFHKYRMMERLGITSSAALIQYAVRRHIG